MFERRFFTKKFIMLLSVCLAFVMLANFSSDGLRFKATDKILSAYALEQDDEENPEADQEDNRYAELLPLVFPEGQAQLETTEDGDVTFDGTCSIFEDMEYVYIEEFNISCTFDVDNMLFVLEQDSDLYDQFIESEALVSDEDGSLYAIIDAIDTTLYSSWYTSDYALSELLYGITNRDLISVCGFENIAPPFEPIEIEVASVNDEYGVLNQDSNTSKNTNRAIRGWRLFAFIVAVIVVVYVIVCETAEQIQAEKNLVHNRNLENDLNTLNDIPLETYITRQANDNVREYKLGFADFDGVGCEVASVYNLLISLDRAELLSEVIYNFEKWSIVYAVGWGYLGSNPKQIYKYLRNRGIAYTKYTSLSRFRRAVANTHSDNYIYSAWNNPVSKGLHTFYLRRNMTVEEDSTIISYTGYNSTIEGIGSYNNISAVQNDYGPFIIGYIIL